MFSILVWNRSIRSSNITWPQLCDLKTYRHPQLLPTTQRPNQITSHRLPRPPLSTSHPSPSPPIHLLPTLTLPTTLQSPLTQFHRIPQLLDKQHINWTPPRTRPSRTTSDSNRPKKTSSHPVMPISINKIHVFVNFHRLFHEFRCPKHFKLV